MPKSTAHTQKQLVLVAKGFAILAVVALHVLSLFSAKLYFIKPSALILVSLNQIARFCVPLFLALSGFGLSRKYQNQVPQFKDFILSRMKKLLPLYLLWSLLMMFLSNSNLLFDITNPHFWRKILLGTADYHLYFVPMIFQLYLLFFLVLKICKKQISLSQLVFLGLLQIAWYELTRFSVQETTIFSKIATKDQTQYKLIINWIFYFFFGSFLANIQLKNMKLLKPLRFLVLLIAFFGLFWSIGNSLSLIKATHNLVYATGFNRLPVFIYSSSLIFLVLSSTPKVVLLKSFFWKIMVFFGKYSYLIYLSHTLILSLIKQLMIKNYLWANLLSIFTVFFVGLILSKNLMSRQGSKVRVVQKK